MPTVEEQNNAPSSLFDKETEIVNANNLLKEKDNHDYIRAKRQSIIDLASIFRKNSIFTYARRLYQLLYIVFHDDREIIENLAFYTYKDTDLSSDVKYNYASKLLLDLIHKEGEKDAANAFGLLGSIFKKKWQHENHDGHLYKSLDYYLKGFNAAKAKIKILDPTLHSEVFKTQIEHKKPLDSKVLGEAISDFGYCGINVAFVYNQVANLEHYQSNTTLFQSFAVEQTKQATRYRKKLVNLYESKFESQYKAEWKSDQNISEFKEGQINWYFITLAEAYLGLGKFKKAKEHYTNAIAFGEAPDEWVKYTASVQGFKLLELLYKKGSKKMKKGQAAIRVLLQEKKGTPGFYNNKIGLALSGGGFRASLFHIGVLAKLAETGVLHKVEVISCVSGGSILGAYYYLKLKKLLEDPNRGKLRKKDYVTLVLELEEEFLDKVNKNVRSHIFTCFFDNFNIAFKSKYTRTSKTAKLYDKYFYDNIKKDTSDILMKNLFINPVDSKNSGTSKPKKFNLLKDNWKRKYKVPMLVLNATTLNTGHSWQFTASWMGESPAFINSEYDALPNLRRMYYNQVPLPKKLDFIRKFLPKKKQVEEKFADTKTPNDIRLSQAVAASAGVPGIFSPVEFSDIYVGHPKVLLVDGGVHDNQGLSTLYEQECNMLIVSDASGQMVEKEKPNDTIPGVILRTNEILQDRIRNIQFKELESRKNSGIIRDFILMHFTKNLEGKAIPWKECEDEYMPPISKKTDDETKDIIEGETKDETVYGVDKELQRSLAKIRTDLDAFHESEAYALMYSGYKMTEHEFTKNKFSAFHKLNKIKSKAGITPDWAFLKKINSMQIADLRTKVKPSSRRIGKLFYLSDVFAWLIISLFLFSLLLTLFLYFQKHSSGDMINIYSQSKSYVVGTLLVFITERLLSRLLKIRSIFGSILLFIILIPIMLLFWLILFFNSAYIRAGEIFIQENK